MPNPSHDSKPPSPRIVFVCTYNRIRSPMAAALLTALSPELDKVDSCGVAINDSFADGFTIAVMAEVGIDLNNHTAKDVADMDLTTADMIVCFSETSYEVLCKMRKTLPTACDILYWPVYDPDLLAESRPRRLAGYRAVRDTIRQHLLTHFVDYIGENGGGIKNQPQNITGA